MPALSESEIAARLTPLPLLRWESSAPGRHAAVLLPLILENDAWKLLFIVRSETVAEHRGQVAFPGGARDPQDRFPADTALRETCEEIGLPPDAIRLLGGLDAVLTSSSYQVIPIVGSLKGAPELRLDAREVAAAFTVPLGWFICEGFPEWRDVPSRPGQAQRTALYYPEYQGRTIWGVTAGLTSNLLAALHPDAPRLLPPDHHAR